MASIKLLSKTKKDPVNLYVRFNYRDCGKTIDLFEKSNILVKNKWWSNKKQGFNAVSEAFPKEVLRDKINGLKDFILNKFNEAYGNGETIDRIWLKEVINKYNNRPKDSNENYAVYFVPFVEKFIKESEDRINLSTGKKISTKTIQKYNTTLERLKEFEEKHTTRLRHRDIGLNFHKNFVSYLSIDCNYGNTTIEKYIGQIKTFCREAEVSKYDINPEFKSPKFSFRRQKPLDPYLSVAEIEKIYNLTIEDDRLDNIRDLFIIGLWSGLRVSDFKQLKRMNIVNDNIIVSSTKKTHAPAKIPIHSHVREILKKRNGAIPKIDIGEKSWENLFNKKIKEICQMAKIDQVILGDKRDPKTNRNVRGLYPKYELVSSHICRRSFCSNHYGKLPNQAIMAITTHASEKQLLDYVKIGNDQYIEMIRDYWEQEENKKSKMKVVS